MNRKKIFLAAPISGFVDDGEYQEYREKILELIFFLRKHSFEVYSEVECVSGKNDYDSPEQSAREDFKRISDSDIFLLLYPKKVQTSALIELGYACAKEKVIVIVSSKSILPYLALGLASACTNVSIVETLDLDKKTFSKIAIALKIS